MRVRIGLPVPGQTRVLTNTRGLTVGAVRSASAGKSWSAKASQSTASFSGIAAAAAAVGTNLVKPSVVMKLMLAVER